MKVLVWGPNVFVTFRNPFTSPYRVWANAEWKRRDYLYLALAGLEVSIHP